MAAICPSMVPAMQPASHSTLMSPAGMFCNAMTSQFAASVRRSRSDGDVLTDREPSLELTSARRPTWWCAKPSGGLGGWPTSRTRMLRRLASWSGQAGDPAAARDMFGELLPVRERIPGPEHPCTLSARRHLARWIGEAGDPVAARWRRRHERRIQDGVTWTGDQQLREQDSLGGLDGAPPPNDRRSSGGSRKSGLTAAGSGRTKSAIRSNGQDRCGDLA
jgi:hypothetical protein